MERTAERMDGVRRSLIDAREQLRIFDDEIKTRERTIRTDLLTRADGDVTRLGANEKTRADLYEQSYASDPKLLSLKNGRAVCNQTVEKLQADLEAWADELRLRRLAALERYADALLAVAGRASVELAAEVVGA
jgi:hypothetical protein